MNNQHTLLEISQYNTKLMDISAHVLCCKDYVKLIHLFNQFIEHILDAWDISMSKREFCGILEVISQPYKLG